MVAYVSETKTNILPAFLRRVAFLHNGKWLALAIRIWKKEKTKRSKNVENFAAVAVRCAGIESWKQRIFL